MKEAREKEPILFLIRFKQQLVLKLVFIHPCIECDRVYDILCVSVSFIYRGLVVHLCVGTSLEQIMKYI